MPHFPHLILFSFPAADASPLFDRHTTAPPPALNWLHDKATSFNRKEELCHLQPVASSADQYAGAVKCSPSLLWGLSASFSHVTSFYEPKKYRVGLEFEHWECSVLLLSLLPSIIKGFLVSKCIKLAKCVGDLEKGMCSILLVFHRRLTFSGNDLTSV